MPLCFQEIFYNSGNYYQSNYVSDAENLYSGQTKSGLNISTGMEENFMKSYNVLANLPSITKVTDKPENTFLLMSNDTAHDALMLLQEPEYMPAQYVDNTDYESKNRERFTLGGHTLKMETELQVTHYQGNMAAMLQIGKWFDYLRENNVYDNTKIILVSDHAYDLEHSDILRLPDGSDGAAYIHY